MEVKLVAKFCFANENNNNNNSSNIDFKKGREREQLIKVYLYACEITKQILLSAIRKWYFPFKSHSHCVFGIKRMPNSAYQYSRSSYPLFLIPLTFLLFFSFHFFILRFSSARSLACSLVLAFALAVLHKSKAKTITVTSIRN